MENKKFKEHVSVLLSSYNGSDYLSLQIESILDQTWKNLSLYIRDDGSHCKSTLSVLKKYAKFKNITVEYGTNCGVFNSYMHLLRNCDLNSQYFSFSDQDDVWDQFKLEKAVRVLQSKQGESPTLPLMYFSAYFIGNSEAQIIHKSKLPGCIGWPEALVENFAPGFTIVLNRAARDLVCRHMPVGITLHDWWIYVLISACGKVVFDHDATVVHRRHSQNLTYFTEGRKRRFFQRWKRFKKGYTGVGYILNQAQILLLLYRNYIPSPYVSQIQEFIEHAKSPIMARLLYLLRLPFKRQSFIDRALFSLLFVCVASKNEKGKS